MSHSTRPSAALVLHHASTHDLRALLDAVVRCSHGLLMQVARDNLRADLRQDAEDVVQDMFIAL